MYYHQSNLYLIVLKDMYVYDDNVTTSTSTPRFTQFNEAIAHREKHDPVYKSEQRWKKQHEAEDQASLMSWKKV